MSQGWAAALLRWAGAGFGYAALVYGGSISLLHVTHNRLPSVRDALVLLVTCVIVYGIAGAAIFVGGGALGRVTRAWLPARQPLTLPLFLFTFGFWFLYFNFALSYDQLPFVEDPDIRHMLVFLAVRTVAVAVVSWLAARLMVAVWTAIERRSRMRTVILGLAGLFVVAHVALAWRYEPPAAPSVALEDVQQLDPASGEAPQKVVLLGIDGAEWSVIDDLFGRGELPHLRRFIDAGAAGELATIPDANSPLIWASIYTGVPPARHSIFDFYTIRLPGATDRGIYPVHRTFFKEVVGVLEGLGMARRVTVDRSDLRSVLLWEVAYAMGRTIGIVDGYYYSFPTPQLGDEPGFYLAYGTSEFIATVDAKDRDEGLAGLFAHPPALLERQLGTLQGADFEWQSRTLLDLLDRGEQPAFVNLYTHEPDSSQHWFWKWYEPQYYLNVSDADVEELGTVVPDFYRDFDTFLGELLPRLDEGTVVVIVSDHGHTPCILHNRMQTWHRHGPPGVVMMNGGPVRPGVRIEGAHVYDIFPTVLHLLGLPVPEDGHGKVLVDSLDTQPPRSLPSYDFLRQRFSVNAGKGSAARNEAELERLRNLGYI